MARLVDGVTVMGPYNSPGVSDTPSRRRVFTCRPAGADERACARRIAEQVARRAFRRPVTAADVDSLLPFFDEGRKSGAFDVGIEHLIAAVLVSPEFLYRGIQGEGDLTDLELASRLSFFLWSQGPDEQLLKIATSRRLTTPAVLRGEAQRMLRDPRAAALVRHFALKALDLDKLAEVQPDPNLFPTFTEALRQDMSREAEAFVTSVLLE